MGPLNPSTDMARALGRVRWQGTTPSLMGRPMTIGARLQVHVQLPSAGGTAGTTEGVWLDADVVNIAAGRLELRTSFARFLAEPALACRWSPDSTPLTRRELERVFAESVADISMDMNSLVRRFHNDPLLKTSPLEQLSAYSAAMSDCAEKVNTVAKLIDTVAQELSSQTDRSMLLVGQDRMMDSAAGGRRG